MVDTCAYIPLFHSIHSVLTLHLVMRTVMAYSGGILVLAFLSQQRGVQVWRSSVRDAKFNAFSSNVPPVNASGGYYASVSTNYDGQNYPMTTGGTTPSGGSGGYSNSGIGSGPYPLV